MNTILNSIISGILQKFRVANPKIWVVIVLLIGIANYAIAAATKSGLIPQGSYWVQATQWISLIYTTLSNPDLGNGSNVANTPT